MFKPARVILTAIAVICGVVFVLWRTHEKVPRGKPVTLDVQSDGPMADYFAAFDALFIEYWKLKVGATVTIRPPIPVVATTMPATQPKPKMVDVILNESAWELNQIVRRDQWLDPDWQSRLPKRASPLFTTVVWVVAPSNPKGVADWNDLTKSDARVGLIDPRRDRIGRWQYLALWNHAIRTNAGNERAAIDWMKAVYKKASLFEDVASARRAFDAETVDVLVALECDALKWKAASQRLDVITPGTSIRVDLPAAVIDRVVDSRATREVAEAYVEFLYMDKAQRLAVRHFIRPTIGTLYAESSERFAVVKLSSIDEDYGGWDAVWAKHFVHGGVFENLIAGR